MPRLLKWVAVIAVVFSGIEFFTASNELTVLVKLNSAKDVIAERPTPPPNTFEGVVSAIWPYHLGLLSSLRPLRITLAAILCLTSITALNAAVRLLRPLGISRERVRGLLAQAALATAVLRTVDGAQAAVMAQKLGLRFKELLPSLEGGDIPPDVIRALKEVLPNLPVMTSAFFTLLMSGVFLQLWIYLSSDRFKKMLSDLDTSSGP